MTRAPSAVQAPAGVLLIEDDAALRATLPEALQLEGYRVWAPPAWPTRAPCERTTTAIRASRSCCWTSACPMAKAPTSCPICGGQADRR